MLLEKQNIGNRAFNIINYTVFLVFMILCVFPFYYIFINTISNNELVAHGKILFVPQEIQFQNYMEVFKLRGLGRAAFISVARTVLGTLLTLLGSSFLGYAFCRTEFWNRKFWYRFVVITMYFNAGIIPWFLTMKLLGLTNNFWVYVLPALVVPFYMILFKTYVEQIPASMEESAQLDGAGYMVRYINIILPLCTPILATIAVFASVGQWNSFLDTLFLIRKSNLFTLQYLLYEYLNEANAIAAAIRSSPQYQNTAVSHLLTPTSVRMTISMVIVLPILFVYPFLQKYFVKGIMIGAVKG